MLIGYARVSTQEQQLNLQKKALFEIGCEKVFEDTISGKQISRSGLNEALNHLKEGDTLIVWKLDRLSRSVKQLITLVEQLQKKGIHFKSITDCINTSTPSGRFFFHIMASLAEMERELIIERTKAGLAAARQVGRTGGRRPKMNHQKIKLAKKLLAEGLQYKSIAKKLDVSLSTLYRWLPTLESNVVATSNISVTHNEASSDLI